VVDLESDRGAAQGEVIVKGKTRPVVVDELLALKSA